MASKLKSFTFGTRPAAAAPTTTTTTTTTTTLTKSKTSTSQAVLSINVHQHEAQCAQPQAAKKKRPAFGNLTNNGSAVHEPASHAALCTNAADSKKSRTGPMAPPPALPAPKAADAKKTTTSTLTKRASSKENTRVPAAAAAAKAAKPVVAAAKPALKPSSTLTRSATLTAKPDTNKAQVLEPQMKFADSTEKLSGSQSSLLSIELKHEHSDSVILIEETRQLTADNVPGWEDIDREDMDDEFTCAHYAPHIFKYYREREARFGVDDYLRRQPAINKQMRLLLVDWMVEVQQQLEFNHEVLYLSVKLLDLYLNKRKIEKERLQLLGGAAMFIACKFEERMPPIIDDFIYVSDNAYDRNELIKMEIDILKTVKFDIGVPLSYTFLRRYAKCVQADMRFLTLARYILELSLQDYAFAYVRDSDKACAALYLALKMTVAYENEIKSILESNPDCVPMDTLTVSSAGLTATEWNPTLIHYTGSFVADFVHLLPGMNNLVRTAALSRYKTIFKKYSHQVFYEVAKIQPLSDADLETLAKNADQLKFQVTKTA